MTTSTATLLEPLRQVARDANRNTSFSPEKRGDQIISDYSEELERDLQEIPADQKDRYIENYLKHLRAWLHSHSRVASPMITGPSNFPTARMKKYGQWADNKYSAFREWRVNALKAIARQVKASRTPEQIDAERWGMVQRSITDAAATIIQIDKGEAPGSSRGLFVAVITRTIDAYYKAGNRVVVRKALDLLRQLNSRGPKPIVTDRHNIWTYDSKVEVIAEAIADHAARPNIERVVNDIRIVENFQEDRLQLFFRDKAHAMEHIKELKASAWNWSPRNNAWQRKLTNDARYRALKICVGAPLGSLPSPLNGKHISTVIFKTVEETNTFIERNYPDWGVLSEDHYGIHVALNSDTGT